MITGDPDQVMTAARNVLAEPYGYVNRVRQTIDGPCKLPFLAFGVAPSVVLSGAYEDARSQMSSTSKDGADAFSAMATGLANVAHAMGGAEAANTLTPGHPTLTDTGISSDGTDTAASEAGVLAVEVTLLVEWLAAGGIIAACGALAPTALVAAVTWGLVEPDDASISRAVSGWQSAASDVDSAAKYLDLALQPLGAGWPTDDTSRQSFDRWKIPFDQSVGDLQGACEAVGDALSSAVDGIHEVQLGAFLTASICLGTIITLTALDAIPGAAAVTEPLKQAVGAILDIDMGANVVIIGGILASVYEIWKGTWGSKDAFDLHKPGDHTVPDFTQLSITWDH